MDRDGGGGGTCQTDPSGCMAKVGEVVVGAGLVVVFRAWVVCDGTVGVAGKGAFDGRGGTDVGSGWKTLGLRFIMAGDFAAFMQASIWGSEMVVNSSQGTEGSSDGGNSGIVSILLVFFLSLLLWHSPCVKGMGFPAKKPAEDNRDIS